MVYIGRFTGAQIKNKEHEAVIARMKEYTGLEFTNQRLIKKGNEAIAVDIWVCNYEEMKIRL